FEAVAEQLRTVARGAFGATARLHGAAGELQIGEHVGGSCGIAPDERVETVERQPTGARRSFIENAVEFERAQLQFHRASLCWLPVWPKMVEKPLTMRWSPAEAGDQLRPDPDPGLRRGTAIRARLSGCREDARWQG